MTENWSVDERRVRDNLLRIEEEIQNAYYATCGEFPFDPPKAAAVCATGNKGEVCPYGRARPFLVAGDKACVGVITFPSSFVEGYARLHGIGCITIDASYLRCLLL